MTATEPPPYWSISYAMPKVDIESGLTEYIFMIDSTRNEREARGIARYRSRIYGHANVSNRQGLVTTYVGGQECQHSPKKEV